MPVEPPPTSLIKSKNEDKPDKYCVKTKLRRDQTSDKSDLYKFKIVLFDDRDPDEFLLFIKNFNMDIEA